VQGHRVAKGEGGEGRAPSHQQRLASPDLESADEGTLWSSLQHMRVLVAEVRPRSALTPAQVTRAGRCLNRHQPVETPASSANSVR